jgi:hypothetical protein
MSSLNLSGGNGGGAAPAGGNGRFLLGQNSSDPFAGTVTGASIEDASGSTNPNPLLKGSPLAPTIPDLVGGAESYGLTSLSVANDFASVLSNAPKGCPAALVRAVAGPTPYDATFKADDYLFFLNLSGKTLASSQLGVGAFDYFSPLMQQGQNNNPLFGGHGPQMLAQLPADAVYTTTVPIKAASFNMAVTQGSTLSVLNGASKFTSVGGFAVIYLVADASAKNVTSQVSLTQGAITKTGKTSYTQTVTLKNTTAATISGPLALVLDSLSAKVTLTNATGATMTTSPAGSPYLDTTVTKLAAGASVTVTLHFTSSSAAISYTPRVLNGPGSR